MNWSRYHSIGYEVSSQGDTRFSALYAKLNDGRTIEEAYQLDIKGYRAVSDDWHAGKGNAAYNGKTKSELWVEFLDLWRRWCVENPAAFADLRAKAQGKVLTDRFANSDINQARALAMLINEAEALERLPFTF